MLRVAIFLCLFLTNAFADGYTDKSEGVPTKAQTVRQRKAEHRKAAAAQKRRVRAQEACSKAETDIAELYREFRQGYTAKRGKILDKRLAACLAKKQKYCAEVE